MIVAIAALIVALAGSALAATKLTSTGPLTVCVPTKAGKSLLTPKDGGCKTGYTLTEVGKEGPPGKEGSPGKDGTTVVARARLSDFESPADTAAGGIPMSGGNWTQSAEEDEIVTVHAAVTVPGSECGSGGELRINLLVNGVELSDLTFTENHEGKPATKEQSYSFQRDLFAPGVETKRTLTAEVLNYSRPGTDCTFTIESLAADVLGAH